MIVDCAHYRDGFRQHEGKMAPEDAALICKQDPGFVWLGMVEPSEEELVRVQDIFGLHELAVEDAQSFHLRPKVEAYEGDITFVVLRTARYVDDREEVEFGEVSIFVGPGFIITVRQGVAADLHVARLKLEARPHLLEEGPAAVLWAILDKIVDDYAPVVEGLESDIEEVEHTVFAGTHAPTHRIYLLRREVSDFYRAVHPLLGPAAAITQGGVLAISDGLRQYFRDVDDHLKLVNEEILAQRDLLSTILQANMAVVSAEQNEVVRRISAWAAIITVPTFIASFYGMNFEHMPELKWVGSYPAAVLLMIVAGVVLWRGFKRASWL
ncbi:magnesium and cobalt transport protein CorA [Solirubrobacter soli]|uniref:magnesium and cobalt transport protein CorA n=1 Tax=Solirubrobacter soli TaxID=363832 RepID=UPI00041FF51C|nr:magnesium and cobalt transport protein CorA [Solirubrobacter soli]